MRLNGAAACACASLAAAVLLGCGKTRAKSDASPSDSAKTAAPTATATSGGDDAVPTPLFEFQGHTKGSGGPGGTVERDYAAASGLKGEYTLAVPQDLGESKAYGLLVYFHGDGGAHGYRGALPEVTAIAAAHGLMPLLVKAPNDDSWWDGAGEAQAAFADELLQSHVYKLYNVDTARIYTIGVSGGSTFLAAYFLPAYGYKYRGGHVLLCGGERNLTGRFAWNDDVPKHMRLAFHTQREDFLIDQVRRAIDYYEGKGVSVQAELPEGASHCGFDVAAIGERLIAAMPPAE